jgi:hypothetical protein
MLAGLRLGECGMSDRTVEIHVREAFKLARRHAYDMWKAERSCELRDRIYKKYDGRGFHSVSLEVGRMYALSELTPGLHDEFSDLATLRQAARDDATAEWRAETFKQFLPNEEAA